jgi:hypothetical protein
MAADLAHWWGNDLSLSATGDLLSVGGVVKGQQRVLRRLLTNPQDYVWHGEYGGGLPLYIGDPLDIDIVTAVIRFQIANEAQVARDPLADVFVRPVLGGVQARIVYTDADAGNPTTLTFDVSE